jgi:hypothetical protein
MHRIIYIGVGLVLTGLIGLFSIKTPAIDITTTPTATAPSHPFYGMDFVPAEDFSIVKPLGVEMVSQTFSHDGNPKTWLKQLDKAQKAGIKVNAWLWPQGWTWNGTSWTIDKKARSFFQTVAKHPALFSVYVFNEPYWQECFGCGYTTSQQQQLYKQIKEIANVPIFSAIDSMSFWTDHSTETAFADGVCDYCATWFYPFTFDGDKMDELKKQLKDDMAIAHQRAPNSKIVWLMQSFAQKSSNLRMPDAKDLNGLADIVYASGVDGVIWYVWSFDSLYDDYLSKHPELFTTITQIYNSHLIMPGN